MSEAREAAWAARKAARGAHRACNPETEFTAGWEAARAEIAQSVAQYRAVWPGGSVSAALPSRFPLLEAATAKGIVVVIEERMAHYTAWKEQD